MRIPLSWLREYVPVPETDTVQDVMAALVSVGLEEEGIVRSEISGPIVVGQVLSCEPEKQKNGKVINWCRVDVGESNPRGIVCGAQNFVVGDKIVACLPGAVLPENFKISPRKTYGHVSDGMMASARELGLGKEHDGILRFADLNLDPEVGDDALKILGLDDVAADINVTPDRSYCLSIRGVAREYSHAAGTATAKNPLHGPQFVDPATVYQGRQISAPAATSAGYGVLIDDGSPIHGKPGADRFVARIVTQVDSTAPTPRWMRERLQLAGIRPCSIVVDVTNYIMIELGQPLHAYDLEKVRGEIVVRRAGAGEQLTTLDGSRRSLYAEDLVIADQGGVIALAGVMGGQSTAASDLTRSVLIEAAHFDEVSVSRSSRRHKLPSEAAKRFSRGVDPELAGVAAEKAVRMLRDLAHGRIEDAVTDINDVPEPNVIFLPQGYVSRRIGIDYTATEVENALRAVGCRVVSGKADGHLVTVPSWRTDLVDAAGLSEEVARLFGYHKIPSRRPRGISGRGYTSRQSKRRRVANALAASGLIEVSSYPFVSERANDIFAHKGSAFIAGEKDGSGKTEAAAVPALKVANPLRAEFSYLRRSLLTNLVGVAKCNISRGFKDIALYEIGTVFIPRAEDRGTDGNLASGTFSGMLPGRKKPDPSYIIERTLPLQPTWVAVILVGGRPVPVRTEFTAAGKQPPVVEEDRYGWSDAIDCACFIAESLSVKLVVRQGEHQAFHTGRTAELAVNAGEEERVIGVAGELHPRITAELGLPDRTAAMELSLEELIAVSPETITAAPISSYPVTVQDVALVVDESVPAQELKDLLQEHAGELLEEIKLFDDYRGPGIEDRKKSLAFTMSFRAPDRTLTADEASEARDKAAAAAMKKYGAYIRR